MTQKWEEITAAHIHRSAVEQELTEMGYGKTGIPQQFRKDGAIDAYTRLRRDGLWVGQRLTLSPPLTQHDR